MCYGQFTNRGGAFLQLIIIGIDDLDLAPEAQGQRLDGLLTQ